MKSAGKILGFVAVCVLLILFLYAVLAKGTGTSTELKNMGAISYEIVKTPEAQARGLSGRSDILADYGMLFVFSKKDTYQFWMKDMLAPIDIIWLDDDGTILKVNENVSPDTYPATFTPPQPVRLVLEMKAGEAVKHYFFVGTRISLPRY